MTRSQLVNLPEFFDRYILMCDDVTLIEALSSSLVDIETMDVAELGSLGDRTYAPGKWTIKDIFQHVLDTERIFAYRALTLSRGEKNIVRFDENMYADFAMATRRSLPEILEEFLLIKKSTLLLFQSMNEEMLTRKATNHNGDYSPRMIGFSIAGHQRWHMDIIKDRYLPLI
jgi:hypothetical protein